MTLLARVERLLGGRHAGTHASVRAHVPASDVWEAAEAARRCDAEILISLGGGSAIDCAKLVAFVLAGGASSVEALCEVAIAHRRPDIGRPLPQIAISTTLSAAEFSPAAGVTDEGRRVKGVIVNAGLAPRVAVLDPAMTVSTPRELWLSTGIKALDHAVERFCAHDHQPLVDALCIESARLLIDASSGVRGQQRGCAGRPRAMPDRRMALVLRLAQRADRLEPRARPSARCEIPGATWVYLVRHASSCHPTRVREDVDQGIRKTGACTGAGRGYQDSADSDRRCHRQARSTTSRCPRLCAPLVCRPINSSP